MKTELMTFIPFNAPSITEEEIRAVSEVLRSGWLGTGEIAHQFEEEFADFYGGGYAIAVSSCSMGLQLCIEALDIENPEIITSPITFAATANAILHSGHEVTFCDIESHGCIDPNKLKISDRVGAIIPVHYGGSQCDMKAIKRKAGKIPIIEDCAHMFGGKLDRIGDFQVFSFYPNKNITTGEGGMILTKDKYLAEKVRTLSMQGLSHGAWNRFGNGKPKNYAVEEVGHKGNMPDVLAAIGLVQLRRWPEIKHKKSQIFSTYEKWFNTFELGHSMHFFPYLSGKRDKIRNKLFEIGIGTGVHYKPLHLEPAYEFMGYKKGDFPTAEIWGESEVSLPVSTKMTVNDAINVCQVIKGIE